MSRRVFIGGALTTAGLAGCGGAGETGAGSPRSPVGTGGASGAPGDQQPDRSANTAPHTAPATANEPHTDLVHGPRTRQAVALTFHGAGDPALTRTALAHARAAQAYFTVMAVGTWLAQNPGLAREILAGGHDLGNHTWSHLTMTRLSAAKARREVADAAALLAQLTGSPGRWFRPSGTPRSTPVIRGAAAAVGYHRCLAYDVDPLDYTDPGSAAVTARVLQSVRRGSIVSLHLGHAGTVAALPDILTGLRQRGLDAVTVSQLVTGAA